MRLSIHHFVATSVLVHAAIFAAWTNTQSHAFLLPASPSSSPYFHIALQDADKPVNNRQTMTHRPKHAKAKSGLQQRLLSAKQVEIESRPAEVMPSQRSVASAQVAEIRRREIRNRVLSKIRTHLDQYFVYPLLAQREGWQGRVLLGFSIGTDGMIRDIHVAAGSGYAILDTSAVDALSQVQRLQPAETWLQGRRLELQMPVIFRLQGG